MGANSFEDLLRHVGHKIECAIYANQLTGEVHNVAVECSTCNEVLLDYEAPDIDVPEPERLKRKNK